MSSFAQNLMGKLLSKHKKTGRPRQSSASASAAVTSDGGGDVKLEHTTISPATVQHKLEHTTISPATVQHTDAVVSVSAVQPGLCLSGSKDMSVVLFDYSNSRQKERWTGHTAAVTKVCPGHKCQSMFSASRDKTVKMWRSGNSQCQREYLGHSLVVTAIHVNTDNTHLCSGSRDNTVKLWDVERGVCMKTNTIPQNLVTDVKFVPCSSLIVQTGEDKELRVFDTRTLEPVFSFPKKQHIQMCCDVHSDGQHIISCSGGITGNGCEASLWDLRNRKLQQEYKGHIEAVEACLFLPGCADNPAVITASRDSSVRVWSMLTGTCECKYFFSGSGPLTSLAACQDGVILVGTFSQGVQVLKLQNKSLNHMMNF